MPSAAVPHQATAVVRGDAVSFNSCGVCFWLVLSSISNRSVTERGELGVGVGNVPGDRLGGLAHFAGLRQLGLVESLALDLALLLERLDDCVVLPAELVRDATDLAVLAARLQADDAEGLKMQIWS